MLPLGHGFLCGLGLFSIVHHTVSQNWDGPSPYANGIAPDVAPEDGWNSAYPNFESVDTSYPALIDGNDGVSNGNDSSSLTTRAVNDFYLRILPLGASIVQGVMSSDRNGFRKLLRQQLRRNGWKVNVVGTKNNGNMADNVSRPHLSA
jgi:hypothetical protein